MSKKTLTFLTAIFFVLLIATVSYCFVLNSKLESTQFEKIETQKQLESNKLEEIEAQKQKELSVLEERNKSKYLETCTKEWQNYSDEKDEILSVFEEGCNNAANTFDEFGECFKKNIQEIGGFREKDEFIESCLNKYMSY
jgi:hypothetical protein